MRAKIWKQRRSSEELCRINKICIIKNQKKYLYRNLCEPEVELELFDFYDIIFLSESPALDKFERWEKGEKYFCF